MVQNDCWFKMTGETVTIPASQAGRKEMVGKEVPQGCSIYAAEYHDAVYQ